MDGKIFLFLIPRSSRQSHVLLCCILFLKGGGGQSLPCGLHLVQLLRHVGHGLILCDRLEAVQDGRRVVDDLLVGVTRGVSGSLVEHVAVLILVRLGVETILGELLDLGLVGRGSNCFFRVSKIPGGYNKTSAAGMLLTFVK